MKRDSLYVVSLAVVISASLGVLLMPAFNVPIATKITFGAVLGMIFCLASATYFVLMPSQSKDDRRVQAQT
jgi:hypothetical protein